MRVEACADAVRFARDGNADLRHRRVVGLAVDGEEVWALLEALWPWRSSCPIILFHGGGDPQEQVRALAAGAAAVVFSEADAGRILRAALAVLDGDIVMPFGAFDSLRPALQSMVGDRDEAFSAEEQMILVALAEGLTIAAVGHRVNRSERHARRLLHRLYAKMGVDNRDQAVALASRAGII